MKLGMPALIEYDAIEPNIELCKKLGFNFIELNMNFPYNRIEHLDTEYIRKLQGKNNIFFTMHMPDDADVASFYTSVRTGYTDLFVDTLNWCGKSGVKLINMHLCQGAHMTLPDKIVYINEKYVDEYIENFSKSMNTIQKAAKANNVTICIENSSNFRYSYAQRALSVALEYENIGLTWDVGHDYVSGYTDFDILKLYQDKIKHMHLHDANKKSDHLVINDGEIDIYQRLKFAKKNNASVLVEVKSADALEKSKKQLNKIDLA